VFDMIIIICHNYSYIYKTQLFKMLKTKLNSILFIIALISGLIPASNFALPTPSVSAATGVTVQGYSNSNPSYSLCLFGPGQTSANATVIASGSTSGNLTANLPVQPLPNGSTYSIYVQNASNSCVNGTIAGSVSTFVVYPNHVTNVVATGNAPTIIFTGTVNNQSPYYNGSSTIMS
jgi:hypothetical protein